MLLLILGSHTPATGFHLSNFTTSIKRCIWLAINSSWSTVSPRVLPFFLIIQLTKTWAFSIVSGFDESLLVNITFYTSKVSEIRCEVVVLGFDISLNIRNRLILILFKMFFLWLGWTSWPCKDNSSVCSPTLWLSGAWGLWALRSRGCVSWYSSALSCEELAVLAKASVELQ